MYISRFLKNPALPCINVATDLWVKDAPRFDISKQCVM